MLSRGRHGLAPDIVRRLAVRICELGPAAGAVTAANVARQCKLDRVLSFDMGGTTAKTALIHDGAPEITMDFEVARMYRFKKGSGLPLRVPVVDLIEIGAGGGSIVRIDRSQSGDGRAGQRGADPGPACYGRGGKQATVTDADLVLGYLDRGSVPRRPDASRRRRCPRGHRLDICTGARYLWSTKLRFASTTSE